MNFDKSIDQFKKVLDCDSLTSLASGG